ncbi:hypothetical protein F5887DRAFT_1021267, partial [Amanita rubescens]
MLSPPFTFILVLVALWCAALEKVHACSYPNPYTSLASQSELPLSRRTLTMKEECEKLCSAEYYYLSLDHEVVLRCITDCVDHPSNEHHKLIVAQAGHGAAALASFHDNNLQSSLSPPRSPSPGHGGASTPPPPHKD